MSIFNALTTAVSGLNAQSAAFTNISENIANSQTTGYKTINTDFINYLTESTENINESGSVATKPEYTNTVQGSIAQSTDPLALAISGQGFFNVSTGSANAANTTTTFSNQQYYTRDGNFSVNAQGYIVNDAGYYLDGYSVDPATGDVDTSSLAPIQISQSTNKPIATSQVTLSANLPATPSSTSPLTSTITVYDAEGTQHTLDLSYTQNAADDWTVTISSPDNTAGGSTTIGTAEIKFGNASGNGTAPGTIGSITNTTGELTASAYSANGAATLTLSPDFGEGTQTINLNLGSYGGSNGLTQYAGTTYELNGLTQNGAPSGSFSDVTINDEGNVVVNYTNGQSQTVAQVPITTFNAADHLQNQNGQAFTASVDSGQPVTNLPGLSGAGTLVVGSTESSNVDIATEFTKLIVAQEAYSANAKVVTTADQLATTTINMKQ